jgi:hypothetical protein
MGGGSGGHLPDFDLPDFDLPDFDLPDFDLPDFDSRSGDENSEVTKTTRPAIRPAMMNKPMPMLTASLNNSKSAWAMSTSVPVLAADQYIQGRSYMRCGPGQDGKDQGTRRGDTPTLERRLGRQLRLELRLDSEEPACTPGWLLTFALVSAGRG